MEYIKLTSIMKGKDDRPEGIVSLQKINGECFFEWSANAMSVTDELVFTMQGGKKFQFSNLAKRGKKKTIIPCVEFCCEMLRNGKTYAKGQTTKYIVERNDDIVKYVNSFGDKNVFFKNNIKEISNEEKFDDAFEGKVATYNYYEKELPTKVANDAKAIVQGIDVDDGTLEKQNTSGVDEKANEKTEIIAMNVETHSVDEKKDENSTKTKANGEAVLQEVDKKNYEIENAKEGEEEFDEKNSDESDFEQPDDANQWNEANVTFYDNIKEQLDDLFAKFPQDMYLNEIIPSSKWAKVTYDESGKAYSVGVLTDGEEVLFIGYGVIGEYTPEPPMELNPNAQWVPLNFTKPHGQGYWMLYQSAKDGKNV